MRRTLAAAAVVVALSGCHLLLPGSAPCPARGGPAWRELRSRHFVVNTDLDRPAAAALVADLERVRALVTAALVREPREVPGYVRVVAPAREEAYHELGSPSTVGYFVVNALGEPTVVLHPEALRRDPEVIAHELAHHFAWYFFPRQPYWFSEGLAQFVQTVASEVPIRHAAGVVPRARAAALRGADRVPAGVLLGDARGSYAPWLLQLWSWVLYHWLWNERPRELADFQRRIGGAQEPASAWRAAFPEFDPADPKALARLDAALEAHRHRGEMVYYQVAAEADATFTDSPMPAGDAHVLPHLAGRGVSRRHLNAALEDDPHHPVALALRARGEAERSASLRAATAAHPEDWRAWALLAEALRGAPAPEREAALRRAIALNADDAFDLNELAWLLVLGRRHGEALPFAKRAVELWPSNPNVLDTLAVVGAELGACDEAIALERRAIDLARGGSREELRRRLRDLESGCPGKAARPAADGRRGADDDD